MQYRMMGNTDVRVSEIGFGTGGTAGLMINGSFEDQLKTVSRVTSNKYLACDRGMFELKYFFGSGVASEGGEGAAAEAVKAAIKEIIDDEAGRTLVSASSLKDKKASGIPKIEQAKLVGQAIAEKAKAAGIEQVVFDRNGYLYHGRVKALAEAAREAGLNF